MKIKKEYILLGVIFILVVCIRLYFAFQTPYFDIESYYVLRNVEQIQNNYLPFYEDDLSYGGRTLMYPPFFYYFLAIFKFAPIALIAKIIPNLLASSFVIVSFLIAKEITKDNNVALVTSFVSGFIPIFFAQTINSVSIYSLVIPVMFYSFYCLIKINQGSIYVVQFISTIAILRLSHPSVALLIISLLIYLILVKVEKLKQSRVDLEIILFTTFIVIWSLFVSFKKAFIAHGQYVIWQNIPKQILNNYFADVSILSVVYQIGIIPFIFGVYIVYKYLFREKNRALYILISFAMAIFMLLWLKLIELNIGLMFLGSVLVILFSKFYKLFFIYLEKTKFSSYKKIVSIIIVIVFIITSVLPAISFTKEKIKDSLNEEEENALLWLRNKSISDSTVLAVIEEGFLITSIANRTNVADQNFMLIKDADQRVEDIDKIFTTVFETEAIRLLNKYDIQYIYFSNRAKEKYKIDNIEYISGRCFDKVYNKEVLIYYSECRI